MKKQIEYQISSSVNKGIIEVVITGEVTKSTFERIEKEADAVIKASGADKALLDVRALKGRFIYENLYHRARSYTTHFFGIHTAIVDLPENADFADMQETKARNAGVSMKWFTDKDAARDWLKKQYRNV